ncbi:MAG: hypothetical protein BIFFINMI_03944 [Phycisphaerae bacterium]|nr:hypothetical protein [Phycisphaerae bacterium]
MIPRNELTDRNLRMLLLTEGQLDLFRAKTAVSVVRYRRDNVVALIDSVAAGGTCGTAVGVGGDLPILATVEEAMKLSPRPTALAIGIAPPGGGLPPAMRRHIAAALRAGLHVISGLHTPLASDAELADLSARHGGKIYDVRQITQELPIGRGRAADFRVHPVLTVGTDCNAGKMVTSIELSAEMNRRGRRSAFVPTGQTGIMIAGWGLAIDRTICDFTAGASEWLVEQVADHDFAFVEGQGSLDHTGYAAVTLGQIHGSMPDWMVLCHVPGRDVHMSSPVPIKSLGEMIEIVETAARWVRPDYQARVVAVALNTHRMDAASARAAIDAAADETGLPAFDPIRTGCGPIVDRLIALADAWK